MPSMWSRITKAQLCLFEPTDLPSLREITFDYYQDGELVMDHILWTDNSQNVILWIIICVFFFNLYFLIVGFLPKTFTFRVTINTCSPVPVFIHISSHTFLTMFNLQRLLMIITIITPYLLTRSALHYSYSITIILVWSTVVFQTCKKKLNFSWRKVCRSWLLAC